jgi:xanthine dehydrogenase accessory factor
VRELLAELTGALERGRPCVFCSVVETRGSTPQKAGAAMLVFPDGSQKGTLGGGCVEAEVKQRALRLLTDADGTGQVLTFNLDDNYGWDDGLICGGRMSILADPLRAGVRGQESGIRGQEPANAADYYFCFHDLVETGCTEAIVLHSEQAQVAVGSQYLFDASGKLAAQTISGPVPDVVLRNLEPLAGRPRPRVIQGISYLPILPRITLFIVGGGHVGQAVAKLATDVDFDIWVLDDREPYVSPERFPQASRRMVGDIGATLKELKDAITPSFFALIVTRGHAHDEEALYHLAGTPARYVGMIGSKRKIKLIFEDLRAKGITQEVLERVHAPLGFPIGSQTVPEIAVSIVAELIACRNLGGFRSKDKKPACGG